MSKRAWIIAFIFVLMASSSCMAAKGVGAPDPKKLAIAKELADILIANQSRAMFSLMTKTWRPVILRDNPNGGAKMDQIAKDAEDKMWAKYKDQLEYNAAKIYIDTYTVDEMQKILTFLKSPAGQKFIAASSQTVLQIANLNTSVNAQAGKDTENALIADLRKNGMRVPAEMGLGIAH